MKDSVKEKRIKILKQIDQLQGKCKCQSNEESSNCPTCEKIRALGQKLAPLVSERKTVLTGVVKK